MDRTFSAQFRGRYEILNLLGEGGMGSVYLANDKTLGREVAIKFLTEGQDPNAQAEDRFQEEARISANLKHDNIVALYDSGNENGTPYLVFERVDGRPLKDEIQASPGGRLTSARTLEIARDILSGLVLAHGHKIIHRDLKPGNIMIRRDDERAMILDFGMAKSDFRDGFQTKHGLILGTPLYMAPELLRKGVVNEKTDVYAVGCTLYQCLAGRPPYFDPSEIKVVKMQISPKAAPPLSNFNDRVDARLASCVHRSLEKDPARRYQTAREMLEDIERIIAGKPLKIRNTGNHSLAPGSLAAALNTGISLGRPGARPTGKKAIVLGLKSLVWTQTTISEKLTWSRLAVLMGVLAAIVAGWRNRPRNDATITSLHVSVLSEGTVQTQWSTKDPIIGRVYLERTGTGSASSPLFKEDAVPKISHEISFDSLAPGSAGKIKILAPDGTSQWVHTFHVPNVEDVKIDQTSSRLIRIEVPALGTRKGQIQLSDASTAARFDPVAVTGDLMRFDLAVSLDAEYESPIVDVCPDEDVVYQYKLDRLSGLNSRIIRKVRKLNVGSIVRSMVFDAAFDKNIDMPTAGNFFNPDHKESSSVPSQILESAERAQLDKKEDSTLLVLARNLLDTDGLFADLETFRPEATTYFTSSENTDSGRLRFYNALLTLDPIDSVLTYQRLSKRLDLQSLYSGLIQYDYDIRETFPSLEKALKESVPQVFVTRDYDLWRVLVGWLQRREATARILEVAGVKDHRDLLSICVPFKKFTINTIGEYTKDSRLRLVTFIHYMGSSYTFEVTLRSPATGASIRFLLTHPGTDKWYRVMNGQEVDPEKERKLREQGKPIPSMWGRIRASFPARLLPPPPLEGTISYRHFPGVTSDDFIIVKRAAVATIPRIEVDPTTPDPGQ